jgi:hypothetical protein
MLWLYRRSPSPCTLLVFIHTSASCHALYGLHPKQWWEHQERLGNILQMGWFDLYLDLFFKENQIWRGKFEIPTRSPCMAVSMGVAEIENRWFAANGMVQLVCYWESQMVMTILYISKGLFCMCVKPFHLEQITYPWFQPLPLKQPYRVIWWEFQISLFRSGFSSENWSRSKLNHPICSRSPILNFSHSH